MRYENLSLFRKRELRTARKAKKEFKKEVSFVKHLLNVFLKTFDVLHGLVETNREFTCSEDASFRISYRIFGIMRCAFNSCLEGYYDVSMALLRIAFENHLLLDYLSENEEEAKLWFEGKIFTPTFLRKNAYFSGNSLYRGMSEFVHSSFRSTLALTRIEKDGDKGALGVYDREQFKNAIFLMIMTSFATILWLFCAFAKELSMNEEWKSFSWDGLLEIAKYIKSETSKAKGKKQLNG